MKLKIDRLVLWYSLLVGFVWCNYFNQAILKIVGGTIVTVVELVLVLLIFGEKNCSIGDDYHETRYCYQKLMFSMIAFFCVYIIVYILGADAVSKVSIPLFNVGIPKQIYNGIFDVIFLFGLVLGPTKMNKQQRHQVVNVFMLFVSTVALLNIAAVLINPDLVKRESYSEDGSVFTLGYSFAYVLAILFPILLYRFQEKNSKKLFWLSLMVIYAVSVYLSGYFIAITVIVVSMLVQKILSIKNRAAMYVLLSVVLILSLNLMMSNAFQEILLWLAEQSRIDVISGRLREIVEYMDKGMSTAVVGKTTYRFYIYQDTWRHFIRHPVFGNYIVGVLDCSYDHATLLDMLSTGGAVLGGLFINFLSKGYRFAGSFLRGVKARRTLLSCYVAYIYLTIVNSVLTYRLLGILFAIAPLLLADGEYDKEVTNHENTVDPSLRFVGRRRGKS